MCGVLFQKWLGAVRDFYLHEGVFFFLSMQFDPATLKCLIFHTVRMTSQLSVLGY